MRRDDFLCYLNYLNQLVRRDIKIPFFIIENNSICFILHNIHPQTTEKGKTK